MKIRSEGRYQTQIWGDGVVAVEDRNLKGIRLRRCLNELKELKGKVLEIGCGAGQFIRALESSRPDHKAYGCDISKPSVFKAMGYLDKVNYAICDAVNLAYDDRAFDILVIFDLLEHVADIEKAVDEANRVLKTGGTLHCFVPCEANPFTLYRLLWKVKCGHNLKKRYGGHIQRLTIKGVIDLLERHNFEIAGKTYSYHLIGQIYDLLYFVGLEIRSLVTDRFELKVNPKDVLNRKKRKRFLKIFKMLKYVANWLCYSEAICLKKSGFAAAGVHLTCRKHQEETPMEKTEFGRDDIHYEKDQSFAYHHQTDRRGSPRKHPFYG